MAQSLAQSIPPLYERPAGQASEARTGGARSDFVSLQKLKTLPLEELDAPNLCNSVKVSTPTSTLLQYVLLPFPCVTLSDPEVVAKVTFGVYTLFILLLLL